MSLYSIDMEDTQVKPTPPKRAEYSDKGDGEMRAYLRVWETPPSQMLNAYGQSSFVKKTDAEVWEGECSKEWADAAAVTWGLFEVLEGDLD